MRPFSWENRPSPVMAVPREARRHHGGTLMPSRSEAPSELPGYLETRFVTTV